MAQETTLKISKWKHITVKNASVQQRKQATEWKDNSYNG